MVTHDNLKKLRDLNKKLNEWETYYQKDILESRPIILQVPTGTRCNLKCVFCTNREGKASENYKDLSLEEFLSLNLPLNSASVVQLYGWGEPLINPDYEKMFDYIVSNFNGITLSISTNGVLLNDKWISKLILYNNSFINISINAATPESYGLIMKQNKFEKVINNIKKLDDARKQVKESKTFILLSFVAINQNIDELPKFVEIASEINAGVLVQDLMVMEERHGDLSLMLNPEKARNVFKLAQQKAFEKKVPFSSYITHPVDYFINNDFDLTSNINSAVTEVLPQLIQPPPGHCYEPWQRMPIGSDGTVCPCCRSSMIMGNLYDESFLDVWNGDMYVYLRQTVNTPYPPEECLSCPIKMGYE